MIRVLTLKSAVFGIALLITTTSFAQKDKGKSGKKSFLDGKKYDVQFTEKKTSGLGKPLPGLIAIKKGEIQCDLMEEKLKVPAMPYKVILDTTYFADEDSVHKLSFISEYTEEKIGYKWEATIMDYDIEGTFIQLRSGVEKKRFEFTGGAKATKMKK